MLEGFCPFTPLSDILLADKTVRKQLDIVWKGWIMKFPYERGEQVFTTLKTRQVEYCRRVGIPLEV